NEGTVAASAKVASPPILKAPATMLVHSQPTPVDETRSYHFNHAPPIVRARRHGVRVRRSCCALATFVTVACAGDTEAPTALDRVSDRSASVSWEAVEAGAAALSVQP